MLDIDPRHGGSLEDLEALNGGEPLPPTRITITGSGGYHVYFNYDTTQYDFKQTQTRSYWTGDGVEVKGLDTRIGGKGYVIMPPSLHPDTGERYKFVDYTQAVADIPPMLAACLPTKKNPYPNKPQRQKTVQAPRPTQTTSSGTVSARELAYAKVGIRKNLAELAALQSVPLHEEPHWNKSIMAKAKRLVELANLGGSPLSEVEAQYFQNAPTDSSFASKDHKNAWEKAVTEIGDRKAEIPPDYLDQLDITFRPSQSGTLLLEGSGTALDTREALIREQVERIKIREEARDRVAAEKAEDTTILPPVTLTDFLTQPEHPTRWLIENIFPYGGNVILAAEQKAGKSTMIGNLTRSLADSTPFLGAFPVEQQERITIIDDELYPDTLRRWLRDQNITNTGAVQVHTMRGRLSTFNILDPHTRTKWASILHGTQVLIIDCLRPILDALGLDENRQAGLFLNAVNELATEADIPSLVIVHHMGHQDGMNGANNRARGDSRIQDWADVNWKLTKGKQRDGDLAADIPRYFSANGRDVDQPQRRIMMDPTTRHLAITDESPKGTAARELEPIVLDYVDANPDQSQSEICKALQGDGRGRDSIIAALQVLVASGELIRETGARNAYRYRANPVTADKLQAVS